MPRSVSTLAVVGGFDGAHIGGYLARAAFDLGFHPIRFDSRLAWSGNRVVRALRWRFGDRRAPGQAEFCRSVIDVCARRGVDLLITTGAAPLTADAVEALRRSQVVCINYSTDDPWNRLSRARWFLEALPHYDVVATPRLANVADLQKLGCRDVRYLPFGYDEVAHAPLTTASDPESHEALFVGGADHDRVAFVTAIMDSGLPLILAGSYWDRFSRTRAQWVGIRTPEEIRELTATAKVNLCLVRRENRDGHVMRTFEIAAIGGCILAEDTPEHRAIFGGDGEAVVYFRTPREAGDHGRRLLADASERARLRAGARALIVRGAHTYRDRLQTMISWASEKL